MWRLSTEIKEYSKSFHTAVCRAKCAGMLPCGNRSIGEILIVCLSAFMLVACDIEDERDVCCKRVVMQYRYLEDGNDAFATNIGTLRHFLFDAQSRFLTEVPPGENLQLQNLDSLRTGAYTMVTVGNAAKATRLEQPAAGTSLNSFMLHLTENDDGNADPLYYGLRRFVLEQKDAEREQRFVTQMANVHCKLRVTVKWQNLPPVMSNDLIYRMTLENCAEDYELDGEQGYELGGKHFPHSTRRNRLHRLDCRLEGLQLKGNFVSLRYTDEELPLLRISCRKEEGYTELTPPLDLKKAFTAWGFRPSGVEKQEYRIIVTIYLDGHIGIKIEAEAGVADWVDGGNFG